MNIPPPKREAPPQRPKIRKHRLVQFKVVAMMCSPDEGGVDYPLAESDWHAISVKGEYGVGRGDLLGVSVPYRVPIIVSGARHEAKVRVPLDQGDSVIARVDCWDCSTPWKKERSEIASARRRAAAKAELAVRIHHLRDERDRRQAAEGMFR